MLNILFSLPLDIQHIAFVIISWALQKGSTT